MDNETFRDKLLQLIIAHSENNLPYKLQSKEDYILVFKYIARILCPENDVIFSIKNDNHIICDRKDSANSTNIPKLFNWTSESIGHFWDLVAHSPLDELSFGREVYKQVEQMVQKVVSNGNSILDFGAGDGDISNELLRLGYRVTVFEPSLERRKCISNRIKHYKNFEGFVSFDDKDAKFDCVLCCEVLEHIHPNIFKKHYKIL